MGMKCLKPSLNLVNQPAPNLKELGFSGPYPGGKHAFMERGEYRLRLPNPHQGDIGRSLLAALLQQAGISREEWEKL
jgi:hypothetical protein